MVKVKVPATSANLGPGFDCLGMALDIYNFIEFEEIENGLDISVEGEGIDIIEKDENNLVFTSAIKVFDMFNYKPKGLKINLKNSIPVARGLGSSAACIVGGVFAAYGLMKRKINTKEIIDIAVGIEGHPDNVVPAIVGGATISMSNKNNVDYIKFEVSSSLNFLVLVPDFILKTSDARNILPSHVSFKDAVFNTSRASFLVAALASKNYNYLSIAMEDKLHQPYRGKLIPGIDNIFSIAKQNGAIATYLSGAGPSIVAVSNQNCNEIGNSMKNVFSTQKIESKILHTKVTEKGAEIIE